MKVAVIPARGGSKRIPGKNIKPFCGKPMIAWSIETALQSKLFDRVIVSTDSQQIADIANEYGAEVPFTRPDDLSADQSGTIEVIQHTVEWMNANGCYPGYVCCIYATSPFLRTQYLEQGYDLLRNSNASFAFSVCTFPAPIQRALGITSDDRIEAKWPEHIFTRSQDLEECYHDAGQFYWGTANAFEEKHTIFSKASIPVKVPRHLVQDIDTMEDWVRGEHMFKALMASGEINA
jgi:N-acylneuraminate cytidylyltransferase